MGCFVTGATGFIGRHLVAELLARGQLVWVLVRPGSRDKFERLLREWGAAGGQVVPIDGGIT